MSFGRLKNVINLVLTKKGKSMKKTLVVLGLLGLIAASSGVHAIPAIYADTSEPSTLSLQSPNSLKCGQASCKHYWFGIVKLGDCSYQAAMRNGGITQVHHHDTKNKGWFFLKEVTTKVYGN